jgi:glycosyltransferase involved in cell wall biosynthesis
MTAFEWAAIVIFGGIGAVWLGIAVLGSLGVALTRPLHRFPRAEQPPSVTVVIAARDEAARIGTTLDHLLAIRSPAIRIVIIDDRSEDSTAAIVERKAETDPRLELRRVTDLPDGWLGKPHALHLGAQGVDSEWILFSDADTWISEDAISRALRAAATSRRSIDHVAVLPGYEAGSIWGIAGTLALYIHFLIRCGLTNLGMRFAPVGVGAFNLVRTEAYRAIGGHEALRYEVVDDVKLAILLTRRRPAQARGQSLILSGPQAVRIDWKADIPTLLALIEKNFFAMTRFSAALATLYIGAGLTALFGSVAALLLTIAAGLSPLAPPEGVRWAAGFAAGAWLLTGLPMARIAAHFRWPIIGGLLSPLFAWVAPLALLRSARRTLRQGGVMWRGRLYPLAELRDRQVW